MHAELSSSKDFLLELSREERKHVEYLKELKKNVDEKRIIPKVKDKVINLGYTDYLPPIKLDEKATYKDIILMAMAKEKEAVETYEKFSAYVEEEGAQEMFRFLANEERKHLRRFEEEYDSLLNED